MQEFQGVVVDYIIWSDRDGVKSWSSLRPDRVEDVPTMQRAIDTGAGISRDWYGHTINSADFVVPYHPGYPQILVTTYPTDDKYNTTLPGNYPVIAINDTAQTETR